VKWAQRVDLQTGISVMDLTGLNVEMQHLVIKSSLDWVLERETNTVVVVPEAWKFIPQGRNTPVKLACEGYIRQGAGLGNYLWLDSQDIAGVEKIILKSVPLWILGKQREANEIKRTLDNIPAGIAKPKPAAIATLKLGQFFACWDEFTIRTYVQPVWLDDDQAQSVAMGKAKVTALPPAPQESEDDMDEKVAKEILAGLGRIEQSLDRVQKNASKAVELRAIAPPTTANGSVGDVPNLEDLYQLIVARLRADAPAILKMVAQSPELHVTIERPVVEVDGKTLRGRLVALLADGFFDEPTAGNAAYNELTRVGFRTAKPNVWVSRS
jgi:hypothetical protein